jgi:hypothetical protein
MSATRPKPPPPRPRRPPPPPPPPKSLILKRAPIGWNQDDYDVVEDGVIVGRIFLAPAAPESRPWMWATGHNRGSAVPHTATRQRAKLRWRRSPSDGGASANARRSAWFGRAGYSAKHWDSARVRRCSARGTNPGAISLMKR